MNTDIAALPSAVEPVLKVFTTLKGGACFFLCAEYTVMDSRRRGKCIRLPSHRAQLVCEEILIDSIHSDNCHGGMPAIARAVVLHTRVT